MAELQVKENKSRSKGPGHPQGDAHIILRKSFSRRTVYSRGSPCGYPGPLRVPFSLMFVPVLIWTVVGCCQGFRCCWWPYLVWQLRYGCVVCWRARHLQRRLSSQEP